jgi:cytochrome b561
MPARFLKDILHWITAAAALAVLLTALPSDWLSALRPGQGRWLYWHIAGGWVIAAATVIRFGRYVIVGDRPAVREGAACILMLLMLAVLAADIAAGLLAFRNLPMRAPLTVLGLFEAPVLFHENHGLHWTAVSAHRWLSYLLAGLLAMHAPVGLHNLSRRLRSTSIRR